MGLRMEDLHTPSVPSRSMEELNEDELSLIDLSTEKKRMEEELKALGSVLTSHGVDMNTCLTTSDGFPRDDLDVTQIRITRMRIIRLRNDYKKLMSRVEDELHAYHASMSQSLPNTDQEDSTGNISSPSSSSTFELPFAKVGGVTSGSPAEDSGLRAGDQIRKFGTINWTNHEKLSKVAEIVRANEGRSITVKVLRQQSNAFESEELEVYLSPRQGWGGRGLLGCHLFPL